MLKDNMLKPTNETYSKCKYQLKQKTITREKMLQLIKSMFFENRSKFPNPKFNLLGIIVCTLWSQEVNDPILKQIKLAE